MKEQYQSAVLDADAFGDTGINISSQEAVPGSNHWLRVVIAKFVKRKVECWINEVKKLALIAKPSHMLLMLLTSIKEHGFYLDNTVFTMRYRWMPDQLPDKFICGSQFNVEHAFTCSHGGFRFLRHNEIRDLTAKLFTEVCHNVKD